MMVLSTFLLALLPLAGLPLTPGAESASAQTQTTRAITDQAVTDAVEDELLHDPVLSPARLDMETEDGVVTLHGRALSILEKERAERIAETVKGVRSVINLIQVRPAEIVPDDGLQRDVEAALMADPAIETREVMVSVVDGVVTLSGTVDSWMERSLLMKAARSVRGITEVRDRIEVDPPTDRDPNNIRAEVEQALRWDVLVDHGLMEVAVEDATVHLGGVVGSAAEKRQARYDAWVAGVDSVDASDLTVARWARDPDLRRGKYDPVTDAEIQDAVELALLYDPRVRGTRVSVEVDGHVVTLRGRVDHLGARRAAGSVSRNTVGVHSVVNRVKVRPSSPPSHAVVADGVDEALARDPYVDTGEVMTTVAGGVVTLSGTVASTFVKARADRVASRVEGVLEVRNLLQVVDDTDPLMDEPYVDNYDPDAFVWSDFDPPYTELSDAALETSIENEFFWSPFVDGDDVDVRVEDGVATLTGTVDSLAERRDATENAYEGGAVRVDNELEVR
jgi:osmotically-inducible protein OsmY